MATGIAFGFFAGLLFFLFSHGVNLSLGVPVIRLGGIACASVLGIIVLQEPVNFQSLAGFALAALGIFLIAALAPLVLLGFAASDKEKRSIQICPHRASNEICELQITPQGFESVSLKR